MVLYVAVVAILNVALGYAVAVYLRSDRPKRRTANPSAESDEDESGDYGSGDYNERTYEHELESPVTS